VRKVEELASSIKDAITIPIVIQEVLELTASKDANARAISKAISHDPILSAKVLKTVNSSFFGFIFKTGDIRDAVVRLGVKQIRSITVAMSIGKLFDGGESLGGYSRLGVWEHSLAVGVMCELVTKICGCPEAKPLSSDAMLTGVLHDIGIILAEQTLKKEYHQVLAISKEEHIPLHLAEKRALGFSHAELASEVLKRWRLPKPIYEGVRVHHDKELEHANLLGKICTMSEYLTAARKIGFPDLTVVPRDSFGHLQLSLGLVGKKVANLRSRFDARMAEAQELFQGAAAV